MAASILANLDDFFTDSVTVTSGTVNQYGDWTASGGGTAYDCYISGKERIIRNSAGQEVTSTLKITIQGTPGLQVATDRFTLPTKYNRDSNLEAIDVKVCNDENSGDASAHHEVAFLP